MLTDAKLRKMNGKPIPKRIELSDAKGLSVRVTPNCRNDQGSDALLTHFNLCLVAGQRNVYRSNAARC